MLTILLFICVAVVAIHAMFTGNVAATVFYCFCLHWLRDCFVITDEEDGEDV